MLKKTKANYLNYAGDICWEIDFQDCLFVVLAIYCKERRSGELFLSCIHNRHYYFTFCNEVCGLFCGGFVCFSNPYNTDNTKEKRQVIGITTLP